MHLPGTDSYGVAEAAPPERTPESVAGSSQWDRLLRFVGYGSLAAPLWFVGLEEGTAKQTVENSLLARERFEPVMDLGDAVSAWGFPAMPTNPTWRFLAKIAAELLDVDDWRNYLNERMGRREGETFLVELLPLPSPGISTWPEEYRGRWPTRADYQAEVLPYRIDLLRALIREHRPQLVLAYGKSNWPWYQELAPVSDWRDEQCAHKTMRHGRSDEMTVVLTYGPTSRPTWSDTQVMAIARRVADLVRTAA